MVNAGAGQVDVGVDEAGDDRGPRKLDNPVGLWRLTRSDALHVASVGQDPLPSRRVRQGVDH
jgi:hypothetical protein